MASEELQTRDLPDPLSVLSRDSEQMPHWLSNYRTGGPFPRTDFIASRIVYYPGAESDGHPLRIFGKAHAAHCFVYVDYNYPSADLETQLADVNHPLHPKGYRLLALIRLKKNDLTPRGWTSSFNLGELNDAYRPLVPREGPFALWAVLERLHANGADHGPERLSILSVGGDGIATFDALFCQKGGNLPYAVLLHDHGFGGNWTKFGGEEGPLWKLASIKGGVLPKWLLVAENTQPWPDYIRASAADRGGCYKVKRHLYRRECNSSAWSRQSTPELRTAPLHGRSHEFVTQVR